MAITVSFDVYCENIETNSGCDIRVFVETTEEHASFSKKMNYENWTGLLDLAIKAKYGSMWNIGKVSDEKQINQYNGNITKSMLFIDLGKYDIRSENPTSLKVNMFA